MSRRSPDPATLQESPWAAPGQPSEIKGAILGRRGSAEEEVNATSSTLCVTTTTGGMTRSNPVISPLPQNNFWQIRSPGSQTLCPTTGHISGKSGGG